MNGRRPRDIGTAAESAVVKAARAYGFPWADRMALHGSRDTGDVTLVPGVIVEVKGGDAARNATDGLIDLWLTQTHLERVHGNAAVAFLVVQRRGVGVQNAGRWWAWWRLGWVAELGPFDPRVRPVSDVPVRCTLHDSLTMLRAAGWGDPLPTDGL